MAMARAVRLAVFVFGAADGVPVLVNVSDPLQAPDCAVKGTGWNDVHRNSTPTGGFPPNAMECQRLCSVTLFCEVFTYYTDTKGCWLQGNNVTIIEHADIIAGPMNCSGVVPMEAPATAAADQEIVATTSGGSGGIPVWLVVLIILLLLCCIGGIAYYMCGGGDAKPKKKKSKKNVADAETGVVTEPLMAAPAVMSTAAPVYATSGSPVAATSMTQMAMPVNSYSVVSPVQQLVLPQGMVDQFTMLDANGDGVLSPEEMQAMSRPAAQ